MIRHGDVVYFKKAKRTSKRKAHEVQFNGYGFGIFLGAITPVQTDATPLTLVRQLGACGFLSFDDIGEFFGAEVGVQCVSKFEDKYYGRKIEEIDKDLDTKMKEIKSERSADEPAAMALLPKDQRLVPALELVTSEEEKKET